MTSSCWVRVVRNGLCYWLVKWIGCERKQQRREIRRKRENNGIDESCCQTSRRQTRRTGRRAKHNRTQRASEKRCLPEHIREELESLAFRVGIAVELFFLAQIAAHVVLSWLLAHDV